MRPLGNQSVETKQSFVWQVAWVVTEEGALYNCITFAEKYNTFKDFAPNFPIRQKI